jgi:pseudouridylate synthase
MTSGNLQIKSDLPKSFHLLPEVVRALEQDFPVVALESTVITHGLPFPQNCSTAMEMEEVVRQHGAIPATIAVMDGEVRIGLEAYELERLARASTTAIMHKISARDFGPAIAGSWSGGTTVAGTLLVARQVGIRVFATGGIGGVHRGLAFDISADLELLAGSPLIVVCAGVKAILDLDKTLEYLETHLVPVIGFQTDEFPAFYSRSSGQKTSARADSPEQVANIARAHWGMGMRSAVLVTAPPPESSALPFQKVESAIVEALEEAQIQQVRGQAVTPFLLKRVSQLTQGDSLKANLDLLINNARIAAEISSSL